MLRVDEAAVIYGGDVISSAVASASARAGRAGGADSRGAPAHRGGWLLALALLLAAATVWLVRRRAA